MGSIQAGCYGKKGFNDVKAVADGDSQSPKTVPVHYQSQE